MTNETPTPKQQSAARHFLEDTQKFLLETVNLAVEAKQSADTEEEEAEAYSMVHYMLHTAAMAVSFNLTELLTKELITLDQAEFLKNQLNNYYVFLIKENIEND